MSGDTCAMPSSRAAPPMRARVVRQYQRLMKLSAGERRLLLHAALVVVGVRIALSLLPAGRAMSATLRLQQWCARTVRAERWPCDRVGWAVRVVSRRVPRATCLTQALATQVLLARSGWESRLKIGVTKDEHEAFCAHAWVEMEGRVIIGGGELERYARLPDLSEHVMHADALVEIKHLAKRFAVRRGWADTFLHPRGASHAQVLQDVTFQVARGELFGLLGPNGAGKTTLFKILSTLITPDRGTAIVAGHDLRRDPSAVREVLTPVIADERSLNWRVSARENLRLYGALQRLRGHLLAERIEEVLASVRLQDTGAKMVGQFSSGMKQRLLIARSLLHRPRVLLLDEPTRSLDPISAREFRALLREEIVGTQGCTVLLATHNPEEALAFCDRVAILDRGRVVAVASPQVLADELIGERYRIWTRTPRHPAFDALAREGRISNILIASESADRSVVEVRVEANGTDVAETLTSLVMRGVAISRFELMPLALAELIERAIQAQVGDRRV